MTTWIINQIVGKNYYRISQNDNYIIVELSSSLSENYAINLNLDISEDNVIFIPKIYHDDNLVHPCIGFVLKYNSEGTFIEQGLVSAKILQTNVNNAKEILENLFL